MYTTVSFQIIFFYTTDALLRHRLGVVPGCLLRPGRSPAGQGQAEEGTQGEGQAQGEQQQQPPSSVLSTSTSSTNAVCALNPVALSRKGGTPGMIKTRPSSQEQQIKITQSIIDCYRDKNITYRYDMTYCFAFLTLGNSFHQFNNFSGVRRPALLPQLLQVR